MATFDDAITIVLRHEGGFQKDPHDSGNWTGGKVGAGELVGTNFGIAAASYPHEDIANLTEARAKEIYERDFWRYEGIDSQPLANKCLDMAVNQGVRAANRLLQQACCNLGSPVDVDGLVGPRTFAAVNDLEGRLPGTVLDELKRLAVQRYREIAANNPGDARFLNGWIERANS